MNRPTNIARIKSEQFDLLIIGGGITGAGIALDAASRGLKTALIERKDFAYGTSSRSTKLIHGGLRYLKQLEFGLVKEVGSERAVVHKLAPHLVIPEKMLLPLYEKRGMGSTLTSIGLKLYDWLAGVKADDQRKMLTRQQTLKQEPLLNPSDVKGGAIYAEYRTDDARLTIEIMKAANFQGASVCNYCEAQDFIYQHQHVAGVTAVDHISGEIFFIRASVVVSAAGPWVDLLREKDHSKKGKHLHLTKGVHIVVPKEKLPVTQSIYFDVGDGRMIFAIPRGRITYIGTTDTNYNGNLDEVTIENADVEYLIKAVNQTFNQVNLTVDDIESGWAGLRPLINEEGKSASELSRKDEIFESPSGLISIAGGKLTGYRKMAERVVDLVIKKHFHHQKLKPCATENLLLASPGFKNYDEVKKYIAVTAEKLKPFHLEQEAAYLVNNFGKQVDQILSYLSEFTDEDPAVRLAKAELKFCLENEMVIKPEDFFIRRTGLLYFDLPRLKKVIEPCLSYLESQRGTVFSNELVSQVEFRELRRLGAGTEIPAPMQANGGVR
ncbi:MAG: glycerol-3-phosphate dehydrogenase/oxidase [Bacteroidetes bacterium]|nr:glycerol-3-phosphate dehydrogenase/oxidase [Bacteroidota bacterium]MBS1541505.1 glycerol-3-phosphate dehydrogenase/oxidase [Bacteroidota bacterium]